MGEVCLSHPTLAVRTKASVLRFGPDHVIDPGKDYTKLTLDAISLASMSYRMNSFYTVGPATTLHTFALT